ncbi:TetR/AcrR family transcriptional regulator [Campylobacter hyointestinalis]|uniref:TetR/AcrR family transcriptional regulator n=4 Tax=Campylobacter hyointestinalis TaxID=198 RepID=A0AAV6EFI9_CAMHY|nr:TetR/AcrR family transcriptional regulator [Campylobacter hyointestinalis]ANE33542.1 multidrug efflux system CmeABC transcriptional regulator, TetR family [Campylobacter hyointestinalis subsp. lawsonii CCUG 27631]KAB0613563.1 TetR/AcrR family transcriptional regulator [Campylobacter hyointestinalis subsp. lawsonii]QKF68764.1 multidrug efflux system CmeABC transcriptional regulator, TetR family [Campylobacter hyointestinalis subsp. lawsonii]RAZ24613.1 TetR/AcrR family transcriptional regulato
MHKNGTKNLKTQKTKDRYELIISAGLELFLKNGFTNTSLNDIINKSGGSLSTIYKLFGNKEGLFKAIIDRGVQKIHSDISKKISLEDSDDLEEFLYKFAEEFIGVAFKDESFLLKKVIFSESFNKQSQICQIFYERGVKFINQILINFFSKPSIRSKFKDQNLEILAARFCFILEEPFSIDKVVFSKHFSMTEDEQKKWVKNCVDFFLRGAIN